MKPELPFQDSPPAYSTIYNQHGQVGQDFPKLVEPLPTSATKFSSIDIEHPKSLESLIEDNLFRFHLMDNIKDLGNGQSMIVQIRDRTSQVLMSALHTSTTTYYDQKSVYRKIIFSDTNGFTLLKLDESDNTTVIVNGDRDRQLGIVKKRGDDTYNLILSGQNTLGEMVFKTQMDNRSVRFVSTNGSVIAWATIWNPDGGDFILEFLSPVDVNTKILVLVAAYYVNLMCQTSRPPTVGERRFLMLVMVVMLLLGGFVVGVIVFNFMNAVPDKSTASPSPIYNIRFDLLAQ